MGGIKKNIGKSDRLSGRVFLGSISLVLISWLSWVIILPAYSQETPAQPPVEEDLTDPENTRPLTQADSILSIEGGKRLMSEAEEAIGAENYELATKKLQQARQVFNQLTNFYLQLNSSFAGIDNRIAESQKANAALTGQMRDEATYQLALVHRAQEKSELAVPLLIQVIRSQNPTSELGKKSYQQLYEIGFVDTPFSASSQGQ